MSITRGHLLIVIAMMFFSSLANASKDQFILKEITDYHYVATKERATFITTNYKKIEKNMRVEEVKKILGEPDEIRALYEPIKKNPKIIGYTYWYIIYRKDNNNTKDESLVRISFNLAKKVIDIVHW